MKEGSNKQFKEKLLKTFKAFDFFCKKNNIRYYAAYGTMLGAIRHHGFIPWDDDIDVYMLRKDYDKFCTLKNKVGPHYNIFDINNKNYWLLSLAKFVDIDTTLWEFEDRPLILGVYIDVFPLDEINTDQTLCLKDEYDKISFLVIRSMMRHTKSQYVHNIFHPRTEWKMLFDTFYYCKRKTYYMEKYKSCVKKIKSLKGDFYVSYDGPYGTGEIMKKEWFADTLNVPFEDYSMIVPFGYDAILTKIYGDYMKLPPKSEQVSHHNHFFLDLNKRWTIEEILNVSKA